MKKWSIKQIRNLGRVVTGKTPPKNEPHYFDGDELFVSPKDLDWDQLYVTQTETRVSSKALEKFKNQVIPKNTVMFTSLSFGFGKVGITSRESLTNQQINSIVVNNENDFRFVYYLLRACTPFIFAYNSGIDTPIVPKSVFERIELSYPEFSLQQKVAAILWAYDELIENNKHRIALLEKVADETYREWFIRLRFPEHEKVKFVKGVPAGWTPVPSNKAFRVMSGGTPNTDNPAYWDGDIPFFTPKDAGDSFYVLKTERAITQKGLESCNSRLYRKDTIFITARGTVGKICLAHRDMAMNQTCYALSPREEGDAYFHFLSMKNAIAYIKGISKSGVFDNIIVDTFKIIPIFMPPVPLIVRFNEYTGPIFKQIGALLESNELLIKTRDALLPRLISDKLSVENLDIQFPPGMTQELKAEPTAAADA